MSGIDRSPARASAWAAAAAAVAVGGASVPFSATGGAFAAVGLLFVGMGLLRGSRRLITLGSLGLLAGGVAAGLAGAPTGAVFVAFLGTAIAWDLGRTAIGIGRQLGTAGATGRLQLVHATGSLGVAGLAGIVAYGSYAQATGGQPLRALFFLLLAAILLASSLSDRPSVPKPDPEPPE